MKTFRTLELSEKFYHDTENLKLSGNLRDQLTRASSSIALNLSEGNAKPSVKEKRRYYQTAYASLKECQTILRLGKIENRRMRFVFASFDRPTGFFVPINRRNDSTFFVSEICARINQFQWQFQRLCLRQFSR